MVADSKTFPVHIAFVGDLSPLFTKAFCGDFKKRAERSVCFPKSSAAVAKAIWDFAYGVLSPLQPKDMTFCLQVLCDAHMLGVDELRHNASTAAFEAAARPQRRVEVALLAELYGTDADRKLQMKGFGQTFAQAARLSPTACWISLDMFVAVLTI